MLEGASIVVSPEGDWELDFAQRHECIPIEPLKLNGAWGQISLGQPDRVEGSLEEDVHGASIIN